eukprot:308850-Amphidinium_carterae.1
MPTKGTTTFLIVQISTLVSEEVKLARANCWEAGAKLALGQSVSFDSRAGHDLFSVTLHQDATEEEARHGSQA